MYYIYVLEVLHSRVDTRMLRIGKRRMYPCEYAHVSKERRKEKEKVGLRIGLREK